MSSLDSSISERAAAQGRKRLEPHASLRGGLGWWLDRLAAMARVLLPSRSPRQRLLARFDQGALVLTRQERRAKKLGELRIPPSEAGDPARVAAAVRSLKAEKLPLVALLDENACLCRMVTLPRASEGTVRSSRKAAGRRPSP